MNLTNEKKNLSEKKGSFSSSAENLCMFCNDDDDGCHSFISYDDDGLGPLAHLMIIIVVQ